jgi:signal transduction histidine kinase
VVATRRDEPDRSGDSDAGTEARAVDIDRIRALEAEVAMAQRFICDLAERLDPDPRAQPRDVPVAEAVERLEQVIGVRMAELEMKSSALEAANQELRSLTQNLDQIVRQRTRALAESEAQLRRKNAELDRLNKLKAEFIAIAAHELRTPMTSVVGYLDLIVDRRLGDLPGDLRRPITSLRRNAHRLKRLVEDMLDASRLETGRFSLKRGPCSLSEIVHTVAEELRPLASEKRQHLEVVAEPCPTLDGDSDKLHQVVSNLVANSIKYTPEGGDIRISVDTHSQEGAARARLRVWDNGIGISAPLRARIFEPFSDVHTAKHHTSSGPDSAGLGLHIARGLVELHGGTIHVDSDEGRYTEFTVLLPIGSG